MNLKNLLPFLILTLAHQGCSIQKMALRSTAGLLGKGVAAFYEEEDLRFAETGMASQLKLLEVLLKNDPGNPTLLLNAAQGFGGYSFLFLNDSEPDRAKTFYARGKKYGLRLLGAKLDSASLPALEESLLRLSKADVPALFWTAYSWGNLANVSRDDAGAIADLPKVERMMNRVRELDPDFFYGGASLFLGAYFGSRPKIFGGDLEKSKKYFDESEEISKGKFLLGLVLRAQYHAVPAQDKAEFTTLLKCVLESPKDVLPEQTLSNVAAREKAKKLMENIDEYF